MPKGQVRSLAQRVAALKAKREKVAATINRLETRVSKLHGTLEHLDRQLEEVAAVARGEGEEA